MLYNHLTRRDSDKAIATACLRLRTSLPCDLSFLCLNSLSTLWILRCFLFILVYTYKMICDHCQILIKYNVYSYIDRDYNKYYFCSRLCNGKFIE
jgi:hypothetical protein